VLAHGSIKERERERKREREREREHARACRRGGRTREELMWQKRRRGETRFALQTRAGIRELPDGGEAVEMAARR